MNKALLLLLVVALLAACSPQISSGAANGGGGPVSWFDAPLPGTIIEPGSSDAGLPAVQLVSHHNDPDGIAELEFSVNGAVIEGNPRPPNTEALITDTRDWTPPGPGEYQLQVRARSASGQWGKYAETYVVIPNLEDILPLGGTVEGVVFAGLSQSPLEGVAVMLKGCGPDLLQITASDGAFNFVGVPAGSCTLEVAKQDWGFISYVPNVIVASSETFSTQYPVPVASDPNQPTILSVIMDITNPFPEQTAGLSERGLDTNTVYTGSCDPNTVNFSVRAVHPDGISGVTFFFRLRNADGETTSWSNGDAMSPLGDDYYAIAMTGNHLEGDSGFDQATVLYQFVIEPIGGQVSEFIRSEVFSDLTLVACGEAPPPPPPPPPPDAGPTPYPCLPYPSCLVR